jgi:hypothetical protein
MFYEIELLKYINDEKEIFKQCELIKKQMSPHELRIHIDYFLRNLNRHHNLPGSAYYTLSGIGNWIRENNFYTDRQFLFSVLTMSDYFEEIL